MHNLKPSGLAMDHGPKCLGIITVATPRHFQQDYTEMLKKHQAQCLAYSNQSLSKCQPVLLSLPSTGQEEAYDAPALRAFLEVDVKFLKPWKPRMHQQDSLMAAKQLRPKVFPEVSESLPLFTLPSKTSSLLSWKIILGCEKKALARLSSQSPRHPFLSCLHTRPRRDSGCRG